MNFSDDLRVLDGGSGYEAIELCSGNDDIKNHVCWSSSLLFDKQSVVREIYRRFLLAGAQIVTSVSYQSCPDTLSSSFGISTDRARELIADSVLLAKDEIRKFNKSNKILCAASIGPYGAHLADGSEYNGCYIDHVPLFQIRDYYKEQISTLLLAEPDLLAFETIPTLDELKVIVELLREYPNNPAWLSMNVIDGSHTAHGEDLAAAVNHINTHSGNNLVAFGVNCIIPLLAVKKTVRTIRAMLNPDKIVVLYPNNGEVWNKSHDIWYFPEGIDENTFYNELPGWINEGARWIGGCCRMGADRMKRVTEIIRTYN